MANPIKVVRAIEKKARKEFGMSKGTTAGKVKSIRKRELAKNKMSPQLTSTKAKLAKATSNKKINKAGASAGNDFKNMRKDFAKVAKKQGKAINPKSNFPWYANDLPKIPVKRRSK
jgi:hypothetical protein